MAFYADLDVEDSLSVFLLTNRYKSENICLIFEKKMKHLWKSKQS